MLSSVLEVCGFVLLANSYPSVLNRGGGETDDDEAGRQGC
jgi:hypothetical protein